MTVDATLGDYLKYLDECKGEIKTVFCYQYDLTLEK